MCKTVNLEELLYLYAQWQKHFFHEFLFLNLVCIVYIYVSLYVCSLPCKIFVCVCVGGGGLRSSQGKNTIKSS